MMITPLSAYRVPVLWFASLIALILAVAFAARADAGEVKVYFVPNDMERALPADPVREHVCKATSAGRDVVTIAIDSTKTFQTIQGIGGAFNEIGGAALATLPPEQRERVLRSLFDTSGGGGAGFSFCRLPIGASDFALDAYSYSETANDFEMKQFSLARDEKRLIPYVKAAQKINSKLRFFATPWSPPGWMKNSGKIDGGGRQNQLRKDASIYKAYAIYFEKYVRGYADRGIVVERITIQNEPDINPRYPGCLMLPEQMVTFTVDHLAPRFKAAGLTTAIWGGTYREGVRFVQGHECMADERFRKVIGGLGLQYSRGAEIADLKARYPDVPIMHTEGDCFNGENSAEQGRTRLGEILGYLNAGCETYVYWNMILDEEGKSAWDWPQNCLISIDRKSGAVAYNADYGPVYLCGRFIRPGAKRIAISSDLSPAGAFLNVDGTAVVLAQNEGKEPKRVMVTLDGREMSVELPGHADVVIEFHGAGKM